MRFIYDWQAASFFHLPGQKHKCKHSVNSLSIETEGETKEEGHPHHRVLCDHIIISHATFAAAGFGRQFFAHSAQNFNELEI